MLTYRDQKEMFNYNVISFDLFDTFSMYFIYFNSNQYDIILVMLFTAKVNIKVIV